MPAFHRRGAKERKRAGENEEGGGRKIREPFVLGDMRMPEKEGTIVVEREYRKGGVKMGRLGKRGVGRRVWASRMSGGGKVPVTFACVCVRVCV